MKLKIYSTILVLSIFILSNSFSQTTQNKYISDAAGKSLKSFLDKIPVGKEKLYGFDDRSEFNRAITGSIYCVYTLNQDFFSDEIIADKNYFKPTDEWRVAVVVDGKYRSFITVSLVNNKFKADNLGGNGLAIEIQDLQKNLAYATNSISILRIYQLKCDFVFDSSLLNDKSNAFKVYPLQSAQNITASIDLKSRNDAGYMIMDVLNEMKKRIK